MILMQGHNIYLIISSCMATSPGYCGETGDARALDKNHCLQELFTITREDGIPFWE